MIVAAAVAAVDKTKVKKEEKEKNAAVATGTVKKEFDVDAAIAQASHTILAAEARKNGVRDNLHASINYIFTLQLLRSVHLCI